MIIVRLKGGLGNQLFQYAIGRHLATTKDTSLVLDTSSYKTDTLREYSLSGFNISGHPSDKLFFFATDGRVRLLNRAIQAVRKLFSKPFQIVSEKSFSFDPSVLNCSDHSYLDGFWQSENYFLPIENTIREDLKLKTPVEGPLKKIAEHICSSNSVSIHVRRGDYVSNPTTTAFHGFCDSDWYIKATNWLEKKVGNPTYFVFSDDYEWAKSNLNFQAETVFIPPSPKGQEHNDMYVMSLCKHNIIANSSFSWWGAWLNDNPSKIVIAPKEWFAASHINTSDLIPTSWHRM